MDYAWELHIIACRVSHMTAVDVNSSLVIALYNKAATGHVLLGIITNLEIAVSGVIQETAQAHGQTVTVWHVTTVTCAHMVTHVTVANVRLRPSHATQCVSTVMATAAVRKQDLDFKTTSACAR